MTYNQCICWQCDIQEFLVHSTHIYLPMNMEETECSETSAYKFQTPGNYPKESIQHTEHGESLNFLDKFSKNSQISNFMEMSLAGRPICSMRTDMTKLIVAFRNFANAPKKCNVCPCHNCNYCHYICSEGTEEYQ